ncbi:DUF4350 domain-containing protein [Uliginosibacterium sp. 31-16]|uniref:DUF4350 domain-containing protein n=1 Tax=Uliginosibacterium sp. 31-16 TaxID=3068315 RepID=UPI00273EB4A1|nr:DUF4350 domain-containing protein [Uliginosibacterium sp. 31-16]MDP5241307.1 DUF4350 domain-containing protein [Uliginosibacterium sp. 31-16]
MSKTRLIISAAALILLGLFGWYLYDHLEWHDTTRRTGYTKEALRNNYHAGMLLLNRLGYPAERSEDLARLDTLAPQSTLLLSGDESFADPALRQRLLDWVKRGGHLVLPITPDDKGSEVLKALQIDVQGRLENGRERFAQQSNSAAPPRREQDLDRRDLEIEGHDVSVSLRNAAVFDAALSMDRPGEWSVQADGAFKDDDSLGDTRVFQPLQASAEDDESESVMLYARFKWGNGFVTVGSFAPFTNDALDKADHASLFVRLLSLPDGKRPVLMLFAPNYPDLLEWLLEHAPEAITGLALLILAGLWRAAPRFGPLQPEPEPVRPGLREHLAASGYFLLKQRSYEALIAPLREDVLRQLEHLQHRHPEIEGRDRLGEHLSGIKAGEITRAFAPEPDSQHEFLRRAQTLATLRAHCNQLRQTTPGALS